MDVKNADSKRMPIKKRLLRGILGISIILLTVAIVTSMVFMLRMSREAEAMLSEELSRSLRLDVEQKADTMEVMFDKYEKILSVIRKYIENMYADRDALVATGRFVDSPRKSTGKDVYAMTSAFARPDVNLDDYMDDIRFFSHLENIADSVARENEDEITTIYLGTESGYLFSYDKWSWLSAVPEPEHLIYDYTRSDWYTKGMNAQGIIYTGLYMDSQGRGLTLTIGTPFRDQTGKTAGVLAADFDITAIHNEMISMEFGDGARSFAIDKDGKLIGTDSGEAALAADTLPLSDGELSQLMSGSSGVIRTEDAFYAYAPVEGVDWVLCAVVPQSIVLGKAKALNGSFNLAMIVLGLIAVLLVIAGIYFSGVVTRSIIRPIELLVSDMQHIAGGDLGHRAVTYRNDEIGDLSANLNEMVDRLRATMNGLTNAQDRAEKMTVLANKDALTGVRNKTSYDRHLRQYERELAAGDDKIGVIMIDLNYLKQINDTYGHDKGDFALKKLCGIVCEVFKHSPVFRVGGDEFVVILKGDECDKSAALIDQFQHIIDSIMNNEELEPWQRTSAAIGCALYDSTLDSSVEDVFKRADAAMYDMKKKMKAVRT